MRVGASYKVPPEISKMVPGSGDQASQTTQASTEAEGCGSTQAACASGGNLCIMFDDVWFVFKDYVVWCKRRLALLAFGSATCSMVPFVSVFRDVCTIRSIPLVFP